MLPFIAITVSAASVATLGFLMTLRLRQKQRAEQEKRLQRVAVRSRRNAPR